MGSSAFNFPPPPPPPPSASSTSYTATRPPNDSFRGHGRGRGGAQHRGRGRGNSQRGYRGAGGNGPRPGNFQRGYGGQNPSMSPHMAQGHTAQNETSLAPPYSSTSGLQQQWYPPAPASNPQITNASFHRSFQQGPPPGGSFEGSHLSYTNKSFPASHNSRSTESYEGGYGGIPNSRAGKRIYDTAFGDTHSRNMSAPQVPLPVPSFGAPLPSKPPVSAHPMRKPAQPRKKHNQLGLTPRTDDQDSAGSDADVDEEAKLAQEAGELKVVYKGKTATLQTTSDIQAWIEERKKKFPTMAKIEQRKREAEEKKAALELKRAEEATLREQRARELEQKKKLQQDKGSKGVDAARVAAKARLKAEKLRKKLIKEEKRAAQAEAFALGASNANRVSEASKNMEGNEKEQASGSGALGGETNLSDFLERESPAALHTHNVGSDGSSNETSSSGSDSSLSDSESDSAPEEATSKRIQPERVQPPPRQQGQKTKKPCHQFLKTGKCHRNGCNYSHEVSEGQEKTQNVSGGQTNKSLKNGLFQKLVARQKEEENRRIMQAILWLGAKGALGGVKADNCLPSN